MPFGLNDAPATYQRCIDVVLMGLKGIDCSVYLDDIICFSTTMEEHVRKLQTIFERLQRANFEIQTEKCVFATVLNTWDTFVHPLVLGLILKRSEPLRNILYQRR